MQKMKMLNFRSEVRPDSDTDDLYIFDEIGEFKWGDDWEGWGPERLREELATCPHNKLTVHLNSNGGSTFQGVAIHNMLKATGKEITISIEGLAASAASFIAMAGDHIKMGTASMLMIHNCWTIAMGNSKGFRKLADDMDKIMVGQKEVMLQRSSGKVTAEKLDELLEAETYLTAKECMEYGWCDEIVDAPQEEPEEKADEPVMETTAEIKSEEKPEVENTPDIEPKTKSFWDFF